MKRVIRNVIGVLSAIVGSLGLFLLVTTANVLSASISKGDYAVLGVPTALILGAGALALIYVLVDKGLSE